MNWHLIADYIAVGTFVIALVVGVVGLVVVKRTRNTSEVIDGPVLAEFREVLERVVKLELQLAAAWAKIDEMEVQEHDLIRELARREERILLLERENEQLSERVAHLEEVCHRAGINGDDLNENTDV